MTPLLTICVVTPVLAVLCWNDCRYRRLPNVLTFGLAVLGLVWRFVFGGMGGAVDGLVGGLVCGLFLLLPFLLGGTTLPSHHARRRRRTKHHRRPWEDFL